MHTLTISREAKSRTGKTRSFSAVYLASIRCDAIWEGGQTDTGLVVRPVYLAVAGSDAALKPFLANLRMGRKAVVHDPKARSWDKSNSYIALLKSIQYGYAVQRHGDSSLVQVYLPEVWQVDPGMTDPEELRFMAATPVWWHSAQMETVGYAASSKILEHARHAGLHALPTFTAGHHHQYASDPFTDDDLLDLVPEAARFIQYLDRRTRRPIINTPAFYLQAYLFAFRSRLASRPVNDRYRRIWWQQDWAVDSFQTFGIDRLGLRPPVAFKATADQVDEFLAGQVRLYKEVTDGTA